MIITNKCPNCGANILDDEEKSVVKCPYCNSTFNVQNNKKQTATIKDLQIDESEVFADKPGKINVVVFAILFCINPVIGIIYMIIKTSKNK